MPCPPCRARLDGSVSTPDTDVFSILRPNKLSNSGTATTNFPSNLNPGLLALPMPTPPVTGTPDRAARKGGVQFHGMGNSPSGSLNGKDGGNSVQFDSANSQKKVIMPKKKSAKNVSGGMDRRNGMVRTVKLIGGYDATGAAVCASACSDWG